jgi:RNA recognition motif-containing protein
MKNYFSKFGVVRKAEILKDKNTGNSLTNFKILTHLGKSRCFGFIEFEEDEAVNVVLG